MRFLALVSAALLLGGCPAPEGKVYSVSSPEAAAHTLERLQPIVDQYEFDGELRISGGPLDGAKMGRGQLWPWASVTKQVVSTLVMQDVEDGRLSLDTPVDAYLREWPQGGPQAPSLRQLMRHNSGLYDPEDDASFDFDGSSALDPMVCAEKRSRAPGSGFDYNNCDFLLVGLVLERVNEAPLEDLFRDRVFAPAGLFEARFVTSDTELATSENGTPANRIAHYGAAGGLAGTAWDLVRFDEALMDGRLLSADARAEMWQGVPELGYTALGQWEATMPLEGCAAPVRIIERRGAIGGYQARNFIIPERGIAIAALIGKSEEDYSFGEPWSRKGLSYDLLSAAVCTK